MDTQRSLADRLWTLETRNRRMGIASKAAQLSDYT
ncbi:hypothetical protein ABIE51_003627 [Lysobacter sp. OAE881]